MSPRHRLGMKGKRPVTKAEPNGTIYRDGDGDLWLQCPRGIVERCNEEGRIIGLYASRYFLLVDRRGPITIHKEAA
jgi:hypothetical protein